MISAKDFILAQDKMEKEYQLVEVSKWNDFNTKQQLGFYYTVMFPKLKYEKIRVGIKMEYPAVSNEELEQVGQIPVIFDGLIVRGSLYNGRFSARAEAKSVQKVGSK